MTTHTPEPWHPEHDEWGYNTSGVILGPEGPIGRAYAIPEREANAQLMASAPAMLKALEAVAEGIGPYSRDQLTHAENTIEAMKELAVAAIAAAKGGRG